MHHLTSSGASILRDRNWRPEGGEWEPIKISFEIDPSDYIPKITTNPQILDEVWSSYSRAKPTQITPRNEREKARKRSRKTADLAVRDRSDRLLWAVRPVGLDLKFQTGQTGCSDRSDRFCSEQNSSPRTRGDFNITRSNYHQMVSKFAGRFLG